MSANLSLGCSDFDHFAYNVYKATKDCTHAWATVTPMGELDGIPCSWPWQDPTMAVAAIWEIEDKFYLSSQSLFLSSSSLSAFEISKSGKKKKRKKNHL